jgi:uncharacterized membrane protein YkoI
MNNLSRVVLVSGLAVLTAVFPAHAQEKKLQRSELPALVQKTVDEQSQGVTIKGFSTEVEEGKKIYEVQLTVNGHGKDISMDQQGHVLEIEEETPLESLPPAVRDGLTKAAGKGKIWKVESLTKNGKLVAYEAAVKTGTKTSEVQVGPDGKKLAHPE